MGYWKGSALSVVLDMLATLLSNGASVTEVTHDNGDEFGISQVFIAIDVDRLIPGETRQQKLDRIRASITGAEPADSTQAIRLPGDKFPPLREENERLGIPVDERVWARIQALQEKAS